MSLDNLKLHLKLSFFCKEFKQIILVYSFALLSLIIIGYIANIIYTTSFFTVQSQLFPKNILDNSDVYLFVIGFFLLLIFYVIYALFFYPRKFNKDLKRIDHFILALKNGEKITDYQIISSDKNESLLRIIDYIIPSHYIWFELTDESFVQVGSEEYFLVPNYCQKTILEYYDSYGKDTNVEDTWKELKR